MFTIDMRKVVCNVISESLKLLCQRWEWFVELGIDCIPDCFGVLVLTWIRSLHQSGDATTSMSGSGSWWCYEKVVGFKRCIKTSFSFQLDWILKCKRDRHLMQKLSHRLVGKSRSHQTLAVFMRISGNLLLTQVLIHRNSDIHRMWEYI